MATDCVTRWGKKFHKVRGKKPVSSRRDAQSMANAMTRQSAQHSKRYGVDERKKVIIVPTTAGKSKKAKKQYALYERFI